MTGFMARDLRQAEGAEYVQGPGTDPGHPQRHPTLGRRSTDPRHTIIPGSFYHLLPGLGHK